MTFTIFLYQHEVLNIEKLGTVKNYFLLKAQNLEAE